MKRYDIAALVEDYSDMVMRIAYQHCFNKSDSEDITQEVFLKLMDNVQRIPEGDGALKAWLIRVTINLCKDLNKCAWYRLNTPLEQSEEAAVPWQDDELELWDELRRLQPDYRTILYLYYYEGYKIKEIARILKLKENTVSSRLTRARKELKGILLEGDDASWKTNIAICSQK